jgi:hypothetical protein
MKTTRICVLGCLVAGVLGAAAVGADIKLKPVRATGGYSIVGNTIIVNSTPQWVFLEVTISGWDPDLNGTPTLRTWQAEIDSDGYSSGLAGTLTPASTACAVDGDCRAPFGGVCSILGNTCVVTTDCTYYPYGEVCGGAPCDYPTGVGGYCSPGFQFSGRTDGVLLKQLPAVDVATLDYRYGATTSPSGPPMADPGTPGYGGTLVLNVPVGARGTFTVGFTDSGSFLRDPDNELIPPPPEELILTSAEICVRCYSAGECDDGKPCTDDSCTGGCCVNEPVDCSGAGDQCNTAECDESGPPGNCNILTPKPNGTACNDGLFCSVGESCQNGSCVGGSAYNCDTLDDQCNDGVCNEVSNQCERQPINEGLPCNDGLFCTDGEVCTNGTCGGGTAHDCSYLNSQCTLGICNESLDTCQAQPINQNQPCDDGLCCIVGEICSAGVCGSGTARNCSDGLSCTTDTFDEGQAPNCCVNTLDPGYCLIAGVCYAHGAFNPANDCQECNTALSTTEWSYRPAGSECDDGDACTGTGRPGIGVDTCDGAGVCSGVLDPECNDDCAFAVVVTEGTTHGNNDNRGPDDAEASCQEDSNNDVWFIYDPTCTGTIFVSTTGSQFAPINDPVLSVWSACPGVGGSEIACDDDSGVDLQAALTFTAAYGATYWIRVAGFEDNSGDIVLNISTVDGCLINGECFSAEVLNPANECEACVPEISTTSWSPRLEGTLCGDPGTNECDNHDACDGAGTCEENFKTNGTVCTDDGAECTDDICWWGVCSHPPKPLGTACGDGSETECDKPDTCDGYGACLVNYEPVTTPCGDPDDSQCDHPDYCDGAGECDPKLEPDGTPCDDGDICTGGDQCVAGLCEGTPLPQAPIVEAIGSRYLEVTAQPPGSPAPVALRLTSPDWLCLVKYISPGGALIDTPVYQVPDDWGTVLVHGLEIVPSSTYEVTAECGIYRSAPGSDTTALWGDVVGEFTGTEWTPPNGLVDFDDIAATIDSFKGLPTAPPRFWVDLYPCAPDGIIDFNDIATVRDAFAGWPYPCPVPCP